MMVMRTSIVSVHSNIHLFTNKGIQHASKCYTRPESLQTLDDFPA